WEVQKATKSADISIMRRTLSDVVHTLRQFLSRAVESGSGQNVSEEEREYKDLTNKKSELDKELSVATKDETAAEERHQAIRLEIENTETDSGAAEREVLRLGAAEHECENVIARLEYESAAIVRDRDDFKRELDEAVVLIGRAAAEYYPRVISGDIINEDRA